MYKGYLTDIEGIKVGHAENREALTGCTVILAEKGVTAGIDVRGSGPGTRETDIFDEKKMVDQVHAIVLSGGSAFGLDSASGVMTYLEERNIGFDVGVTKVPIVPAAVIFDLHIGDYRKRPDAEMGYRAAENASREEARQGNVGCGLGATIGKAQGPDFAMKSGLGSATVEAGDLKVSALVAVNAFGDVYNFNMEDRIAGAYDYKNHQPLSSRDILKEGYAMSFKPTNTTIGVVASNARLTKAQANKVAEMAHNGFARTIDPIHTSYDGDTIFALATGDLEAETTLVGILAAEAMGKAVINAVKSAESLGGLKSYRDLK